MQHPLSFSNYFKVLLLCSIVIAAHYWFVRLPNRQPLPPARSEVQFDAVILSEADNPLELVGAWALSSDDPRLAGISGLVRNGDEFLAISDSGSLVRFRLPSGSGSTFASFSDLPSGPGRPDRKAGNDAEAIVRDPDGRGWWVAFEVDHQLRLFDHDFRETLEVVPIQGSGWSVNKGAEALAFVDGGLVAFGEDGSSAVIHRGGRTGPFEQGVNFGRLSDAATLPDGRILLLTRTIRPWGFVNRLKLYDPGEGAIRTIVILPLSHIHNAEALAVEPIDSERLRIWVMTDSDSRARSRTLLAAFDWTPTP